MAAQSPLVNETPLPSSNNPSGDKAAQAKPESGSEDESSSDDEPVAALATTRERRGNAGNRMAKLLELAGAEDAVMEEGGDDEDEQVNLLFQEAEDDVEFNERDEDDSDANMSSSESEDDNQGDEEEGEKELAREQRTGPGKKRKSEGLLQKTMRLKRLKYAPVLQEKVTEGGAAEPIKPKKKSERVSWVPDVGQIRSSSRKLAVANKQATHQRLKESEKKREKTVKMMQAAEERKKARERRALTQEERIAQAAIVEKQNSKSLNRYEEAEKMRLDEQKARLDALRNRRLDGPVITYWSGPAVWVNDKLKKVGRTPLVEEIEAEIDGKTKRAEPLEIAVQDVLMAEGNTSTNTNPESGVAAEAVITAEVENMPDSISEIKPEVSPIREVAGSPSIPPSTEDVMQPLETALPEQPTDAMDLDRNSPVQTPPEPQPLLAGIDQWASMSKDANTLDFPVNSLPLIAPKPTPATTEPPHQTDPQPGQALSPMTINLTEQPHQEQIQPRPPSPVRTKTLAMRSLVTLSSFNNLHRHRGYNRADSPAQNDPSTLHHRRHADRDSTVLLRTLFSVPPPSAVEDIRTPLPNSSAQLAFSPYDPSIPSSGGPRHSTRYLTKRAIQCPTTGLTARYRDPITGLPYANAQAFKMLRGVADGERGVWSGLFQAWVGESGAAKGVPEGVWEGTVERRTDVDEKKEAAVEGNTAKGNTAEAVKS